MPPPLRCPSTLPLVSCTKQLCKAPRASRSFSTTLRHDQRVTRARRQMFMWLATQGSNFLSNLDGSTNYLGAYNAQGQLRRAADTEAAREKRRDSEQDGKKPAETGKALLPPETNRDLMPFPMNRAFVSQAVLSEDLREDIWSRIMKDGKSVREVSAELSVEMSRVGAVVRLMEIEKEWQRIGKPLARPYAKAVMSMLPKTTLNSIVNPTGKRQTHESINDLPVHAYTGQQIFHPTSESRHFTRADAAKVFHEKLLPADERVPHPELAQAHREMKEGLGRREREELAQAREDAEAKIRDRAAARRAKHEASIQKIDTGRWEFRFTDINVDDAGKNGRGNKGVGWRYGTPLMDRKRGTVKIPTSVQ